MSSEVLGTIIGFFSAFVGALVGTFFSYRYSDKSDQKKSLVEFLEKCDLWFNSVTNFSNLTFNSTKMIDFEVLIEEIEKNRDICLMSNSRLLLLNEDDNVIIAAQNLFDLMALFSKKMTIKLYEVKLNIEANELQSLDINRNEHEKTIFSKNAGEARIELLNDYNKLIAENKEESFFKPREKFVSISKEVISNFRKLRIL